MRHIAFAVLLSVASIGAANAQATFENFETDFVPDTWETAGNNSYVHLTGLRYKSGHRSLLWRFDEGGSLTYRAPEGFGALTEATEKEPGSALGFWMYNEAVMDAFMPVEFLDGDEVVGECWIAMDFTGWRPIGMPYSEVLENGENVDAVRFVSPEDMGQWRVYIDYFTPNVVAAVPRSYQVPWVGVDDGLENPERVRKSPDDIALNRPWIPECKNLEAIDRQTREDIEYLQDRWLPEAPKPGSGVEANTLADLREQMEEWNIEDDDDVITGRPVDHASFIKPPDAVDIEEYMNFCGRVKDAYLRSKGENRDELAEMFVTLTRHFLDQGWDYGSGLRRKPSGYVYRNWPPIFYSMRAVLTEAGIIRQVALALLHQMAGSENALSEEPYASMDTLHLANKALLPCICMLPDIPEREQWLRAIQRYYSVVLVNRKTLGPDGCAYHHWFHHFSYASYSMPFAIRAAHSLADTVFRIGQDAHERLKRYVYAMSFAELQGTQPWNMNGRAGTPISHGMTSEARLLAEMGTPDGTKQVDPQMAALYLRLTDEPQQEPATTWREQGIEPASLTGHLTLNGTAAALHRRDNWLVSVVGMIKFWRGLEIYGWHQSNNYGRYARHGSIFVGAAGDPPTVESSGYQQEGWNWCHFPGTTCLQRPVHEMFNGYAMFGNPSPVAGGTTLGDNGTWGMDFQGLDVHFKQSVFCFDNRITVMKTGITSEQDRPVVTTLFQNSMKEEPEPLCVDGTEVSEYPWTMKLSADAPRWLMDNRGTGYYIHPGHDPIQLACHEQQWTYMFDKYLKDPDDNPVINYLKRQYRHDDMKKNHEYFEPTTGRFALGYYDHGTKPKDSRLVYTMLVDSSPEEVNAFAEQMRGPDQAPIEVRQADSSAHILRDVATDTTGYTLFTAAEEIPAGGHLRGASRPCFVMIKENAASLDLSVSSSDIENTKPIELRIRDFWHVAAHEGIPGEPEISRDGFATVITLPYEYYMPMTLHLVPRR
ncbi:MAG: chondroitinase family polysaccharide lyase [Armatimonadota bacterium]